MNTVCKWKADIDDRQIILLKQVFTEIYLFCTLTKLTSLERIITACVMTVKFNIKGSEYSQNSKEKRVACSCLDKLSVYYD